MKVIQELIAYFERRGRLTPQQLERLLAQGLLAADAPENMVALGQQVGQSFYFRVRGEKRGSVWGTDVYTGDSSLAAAALHAGLVGEGEAAVLKVTVVAPLQQDQGSTRHGVSSQSYGPYGSAYRLALAVSGLRREPEALARADGIPPPGDWLRDAVCPR
jgi:hypothetical protein